MGLVGLVAELVVLGCIAAGIAANAAVVGGCNMLSLGRSGLGHLGPWRVDIGDGNGCVSWYKDTANMDDWLTNMARACSMMALVFGSILVVFAFFNQCLFPLPCTQHVLDLCGVGVQVGLALTWPMIRSNVCDSFGGCYWDDGAYALLFSQLFYFCASIFSRCMREPRYKRRQEERRENENDKAAKQQQPDDTHKADEEEAGKPQVY